MNTTLYQNLPKDTQELNKSYLEPHDYRIYYVNTDLRQLYGISTAESQTFLRAKRPQRRRARRNGCFRRLVKIKEQLQKTSGANVLSSRKKIRNTLEGLRVRPRVNISSSLREYYFVVGIINILPYM